MTTLKEKSLCKCGMGVYGENRCDTPEPRYLHIKDVEKFLKDLKEKLPFFKKRGWGKWTIEYNELIKVIDSLSGFTEDKEDKE